MAFDGIVINNLVKELNEVLLDQRISKIAQPEKEELLFTFKTQGGNKRLLISANASLPFLYLTDENKNSPITAPNFCMLLRKHIANGRITEISQPDFERVICFRISHLNELGDPAEKLLYVELMGKHSNIIFCDENNIIIDSIKHIGSNISSVREVLPGRNYFIPSQENKVNPLIISREDFLNHILAKPMPVEKAIYTSLIGFSPCIANEICYNSNLSQDISAECLTMDEKNCIFIEFQKICQRIHEQEFQPTIYFSADQSKILEFSSIQLNHYNDLPTESYASISKLLLQYYKQKNIRTNINQKSQDMRKNIEVLLDRNRKKLLLQQKQLKDTEKMDKYRVYGELLQAFGYGIPAGEKTITLENFYDENKEITIPLNEELTPIENSKKYFEKYNKLKRTKEAVSIQIEQTENMIEHLDSILTAIQFADTDADLELIRKELFEAGYIHKRSTKKLQEKSKPLHFITDDGFHIYVGKNNYQNDELTFKLATGNDWWFHAKKRPGSHVIVKCENKELPDHVFEEAAALAGYYSSGRDTDKLEIDYLQKKNVKKPNGANPGFVIYYTNFSMTVHPGIVNLTEIKES